MVGSVRDDDDDDDGNAGTEITGTPVNVGTASFDLGDRTISVTGSTLIDDSIIELALGRAIDDDRRFDQLPGGLTLPDLLTGDFPVSVRVTADGIALEIEDVDD